MWYYGEDEEEEEEPMEVPEEAEEELSSQPSLHELLHSPPSNASQPTPSSPSTSRLTEAEEEVPFSYNNNNHSLSSASSSSSSTITTPPLSSSSPPTTAPSILASEKQFLSDLLKSYKAYDLIPVSGKIVVLDTALPVKAAFIALIENGVKSAPLWDSEVQDYVGMITVTDFMNILRHFYRAPTDKDLAQELEEHEIRTWRDITAGEVPRPSGLIGVHPENSLYDAACTLLKHSIHRLPVIDKQDSNSILYIVTHRKINNFLVRSLQANASSPMLNLTIGELGIGTFEHVVTVLKDTPLIVVLDLLAERQISAVPIVDEHGVATNVYSNSDVLSIAKHRTYEDLGKPVEEVVARKAKHRLAIMTCKRSDTLSEVLNRLLETKVHRLICVDSTGRVVGIVSLSDILKAFVDIPNNNDASSTVSAASPTLTSTNSSPSSSSFL
ncbi:5'-AMP-activated protein kinase subunit gamma-2 [Balamuthia mandrillaris]